MNIVIRSCKKLFEGPQDTQILQYIPIKDYYRGYCITHKNSRRILTDIVLGRKAIAEAKFLGR